MLPETFDAELKVRLGRNYRLRRSAEGPRWLIEQKVAQAIDFPGSLDKAIRLREGYHLVLDTPDAPGITCPNCFARLPISAFEKREFYCPRCEEQGGRTRLVDGYFPLVDRTLAYLERIAPRRGKAWHREDEDAYARLEASRKRERANLAQDLVSDSWNRLAGIPQFGYNSRVGTPNQFGAD